VEDLEHFPLALLDFRSINPMEDFVPYDQVSPIRHKELYLINPKERHRWYWASRQKRSELLVFVQYDSMPGLQARCKSKFGETLFDKADRRVVCPHAGFRNASAPSDAQMRKSIETRSVVITKLT
jgi:cephamycin C biosynthesis protein